jgi:predicted DNA binding CopG/RHH family protein
MARKLKPIPKFASEDEERDFWGTHDTTEYFDWSKARFVSFPNLKHSTETISLRLPMGLLSDVKVLANRMDVPYQSLLKIYLAERVAIEMRRGLEPSQLASMVREPEPPYGVAPVGTHRRSTAKEGRKTRSPKRSR